jgi:hypothetical protein
VAQIAPLCEHQKMQKPARASRKRFPTSRLILQLRKGLRISTALESCALRFSQRWPCHADQPITKTASSQERPQNRFAFTACLASKRFESSSYEQSPSGGFAPAWAFEEDQQSLTLTQRRSYAESTDDFRPSNDGELHQLLPADPFQAEQCCSVQE